MSLGANRASSTRQYQLLNTQTTDSTGNGTYTVPNGVNYIEIELWGAGAGGGFSCLTEGRGGNTYYSAGGGGAGAYVKLTYRSNILKPGDTINFTVGSGGAGDTNAGAAGAAGGATTLNTHSRGLVTENTFTSVSAGGGVGGRSCPGGVGGGSGWSAGGVATGGDINIDGGYGEARSSSGSLVAGGDGGDSPNGGAGSDGGVAAFCSSTVTDDAAAPGGGGGGGGSCETTGGGGANGRVVIKCYG